jgi:hypothetical protein
MCLILVVPGIGREEFRQRRQRLMARLTEGSISIIPAYRTRHSSLNILYQDAIG